MMDYEGIRIILWRPWRTTGGGLAAIEMSVGQEKLGAHGLSQRPYIRETMH